MEDLFATNPRNLKLPTTGPALLPVCSSSAHDVYSTCLAVHIRVGLLRRFSELTVFDARLYIRVRRVDQPA